MTNPPEQPSEAMATDLDRKLTAFRSSWERLGEPANRLGLWTGQQLIHDARRLKERGLLETRYRGGCLDWRLTASAIEAMRAATPATVPSLFERMRKAQSQAPVRDDDVEWLRSFIWHRGYENGDIGQGERIRLERIADRLSTDTALVEALTKIADGEVDWRHKPAQEMQDIARYALAARGGDNEK